MSDWGIRLYTLLRGRKVGTDSWGNRYYDSNRGRKRWVLYNGIAEGSKVPAEWHAWLHHTADAPLTVTPKSWQQPHLPNLSGTRYAYYPEGHALAEGRRSKATGDYQAWTPDDSNSA